MKVSLFFYIEIEIYLFFTAVSITFLLVLTIISCHVIGAFVFKYEQGFEKEISNKRTS